MRNFPRTAAFAVASGLVALMAAASPLAMAADTPAPASAEKALDADKIDAATARPPVEDAKSVTSHSAVIGGKTLAYKATAGTLTLRDADGKPIASMFYVAYTVDGPKRPVTFLYNGGPGSSSIWLHMGSVGPVRVKTPSPLPAGSAPYDLVPNPDSLLDKSDLVFIDAIGTGFSRPLGKTEGKTFWGVDQDADAFTKAISRYITLNNRSNSPRYLFGESYGTTRSSVVALKMHQAGLDLNGVILLSSYLNTNSEDLGVDLPYLGLLPTYAATAWYHKALTNRPEDLAAFVAEVRQFTGGEYAAALFKGQDIGTEEFEAVAKKLSAYTGLSVDYVKRAKLRISPDRFRRELLRARGVTVGRLDTRYTGTEEDTAGEYTSYDAADAAMSSAYVSAAGDYIRHELGYQTNMDYRHTGYEFIGDWDFHHKVAPYGFKTNNAAVNMDLAQTLRESPHTKVLSLNGYFDLATPFYQTEYDLSHMLLDAAQRKNLELKYYASGHMVYLNPETLKPLKADLASFYDRTSGGN
jgi:carboxypeptidase C (cathepsin A)